MNFLKSLAVLGAIMLWPTSAVAVTVTHFFEGEVRNIQQGGSGFAFDGSVVIGTLVTGSFSYDTSTTITSPFDVFRTDYFPSASSLFVASIGNYSFTSGYRMRVADDLPQSGEFVDMFTLEKTGDATFTNGSDVVVDLLWSLNFFDLSGTAFSTKDLPLIFPSLDAWRSEFINLQVPRNSETTPDTSNINIVLTSLSSQVEPTTPVVPLPAALPLFGTGLGIMGFIGWRRKRRMAAEAAA